MNILEGLHPELVPYVGQDQFGRYINSPLVEVRHLDIPFPDGWGNGCSSWVDVANQCLAEKQELLIEAIKGRDWHTYIFAHERPYRFGAIRTIINDLHVTIDDLWPIVADAWSDSENIHQFADEWLELWRTPSRKKRQAMDATERAVWRKLPDVLTIYRGVNCADEWEAEEAISCGLSWTLDRNKAIWFARRGPSVPWLAKATIKKRDCFAYFAGREESEIVIDTNKLGVAESQKLRRARR